MKKIFGIVVSIIISVITTVLYHRAVKDVGMTEVSSYILAVRWISDFIFAMLMMSICKSICFLLRKKPSITNFIMDTLVNATLLFAMFVEEQLIEGVIFELEGKKTNKIILILFIIVIVVNMIELGLKTLEWKKILQKKIEEKKDIMNGVKVNM